MPFGIINSNIKDLNLKYFEFTQKAMKGACNPPCKRPS